MVKFYNLSNADLEVNDPLSEEEIQRDENSINSIEKIVNKKKYLCLIGNENTKASDILKKYFNAKNSNEYKNKDKEEIIVIWLCAISLTCLNKSCWLVLNQLSSEKLITKKQIYDSFKNHLLEKNLVLEVLLDLLKEYIKKNAAHYFIVLDQISVETKEICQSFNPLIHLININKCLEKKSLEIQEKKNNEKDSEILEKKNNDSNNSLIVNKGKNVEKLTLTSQRFVDYEQVNIINIFEYKKNNEQLVQDSLRSQHEIQQIIDNEFNDWEKIKIETLSIDDKLVQLQFEKIKKLTQEKQPSLYLLSILEFMVFTPAAGISKIFLENYVRHCVQNFDQNEYNNAITKIKEIIGNTSFKEVDYATIDANDGYAINCILQRELRKKSLNDELTITLDLGKVLDYVNSKFPFKRNNFSINHNDKIYADWLPIIFELTSLNLPVGKNNLADKLAILMNALAIYFYRNDQLEEGYFYVQKAKKLFIVYLGTIQSTLNIAALENKLYNQNMQISSEQMCSNMEMIYNTFKDKFQEKISFLANEILHNCGSFYTRLAEHSSDSRFHESSNDAECAVFLQKLFLPKNKPEATKISERIQTSWHQTAYSERRLANGWQTLANIFSTWKMLNGLLSENYNSGKMPLCSVTENLANAYLEKSQEKIKLFLNAQNYQEDYLSYFMKSAISNPQIYMDQGFNQLLQENLKPNNKKNYEGAKQALMEAIKLYDKKETMNAFTQNNGNSFKQGKLALYKDKVVAVLYLVEVYMAIAAQERRNILQQQKLISIQDDKNFFQEAEEEILEACVLDMQAMGLSAKQILAKPSISTARIYRHLTFIAAKNKQWGLAKFYWLLAQKLNEKCYIHCGHHYRQFLFRIGEMIDDKLLTTQEITSNKKLKQAIKEASQQELKKILNEVYVAYKARCYTESFVTIKEAWQCYLDLCTKQSDYEKKNKMQDWQAIKLFLNVVTIQYSQHSINQLELFTHFREHISIYLQGKWDKKQLTIQYGQYEIKKSDFLLAATYVLSGAGISGGGGADVLTSGLNVSCGVTNGNFGEATKIFKDKIEKKTQAQSTQTVKNHKRLQKDIGDFLNWLEQTYITQILQLDKQSIKKFAAYIADVIYDNLKQPDDPNYPGYKRFINALWTTNIQSQKLTTIDEDKRNKHQHDLLKNLLFIFKTNNTWNSKDLTTRCGIHIISNNKDTFFYHNQDKHQEYGSALMFFDKEENDWQKKFLEEKGYKENNNSEIDSLSLEQEAMCKIM